MQYIYGFDQKKLIENDISHDQALLLKELILNEGKKITLKDLIANLPILHIKEKQASRLLTDLSNKGFAIVEKTLHGFVFHTGQKCPVLNVIQDKNVRNETAHTRQKCPQCTFIYNNINNNKLLDKYHTNGVGNNSNILELLETWHATTHRDIEVLPSEGWNRIFDIDKLMLELKKCNFGFKLPFKTVVERYDEIVAGSWRDFKKDKDSSSSAKIYTHHYTTEELNAMFTNLDEIEI